MAACFATILILLGGAVTLPVASTPSLHATIREAQRKVVKIYGAGGVQGLEAYQTGVLISSEGHVLTANSYVLDTEDLAVVLDDGRKFKAEIVGTDPVRDLALLKLPIEQETLPYFDLTTAPIAAVGDRVLALSNLFGIAAGDEPVSVLQGVVTAVAPLDARRGSFQAVFHGPVYVLDAAANNPGAAGGALVDWQGRLLGLLGKELKSRVTGAWLHYAVPVDQFAAAVDSLRNGRPLEEPKNEAALPQKPLSLADLGIVLVPNVIARTPPYIDSVFPGSAADRAGLKSDDLIVFVAGDPVASCEAAKDLVGRRENFEEVAVSVVRDGRLIETSLTAQQDKPLDTSAEPPPGGSGARQDSGEDRH